MERFEYRAIEVERAVHGGGLVIKRLDNRKCDDLDLHSFLAEAGEQGWEVAGLTPVSDLGGAKPGFNECLVVLKRRAV